MTKSWLYQLNNCALTLSHGVWNPISYTSVTMGMVLLNHSEKRTGSSSFHSRMEWNRTELERLHYTRERFQNAWNDSIPCCRSKQSISQTTWVEPNTKKAQSSHSAMRLFVICRLHTLACDHFSLYQDIFMREMKQWFCLELCGWQDPPVVI